MNATRLAVALTGSYCTFAKAFSAMEELVRCGFELIPVLSYSAALQDTRFFTAQEVLARAEQICGKPPLTSLAEVEPLGPARMTDAYLIMPATGNTIAKLAAGIFDTPALLGAKSHLRNQRPLIIFVSTNDGLSTAAKNIGSLLEKKDVYFVPFSQDDPRKKPRSLVSDFSKVRQTVLAALEGIQLQPIIGAPAEL
jgi:dipicolinate synthase subunit B